MITLRHTSTFTTLLGKWSDLHSYLYVTTHNNPKRTISMPYLDSNPQTQQDTAHWTTPWIQWPLEYSKIRFACIR